MYRVTLEINNSIYEYIMFFLENIPKNLLRIKTESLSNKDTSPPEAPTLSKKELPAGFLNPLKIDSYDEIATRDELYER
jgi:hypothetical protein